MVSVNGSKSFSRMYEASKLILKFCNDDVLVS